MSILNIASQMEAELNAREQSLKDGQLDLAKDRAEIAAIKKELDAKKKELSKLEKDLEIREKQVQADLANIRKDQELTKSLHDLEVLKEQVKLLNKQAMEKDGDANQKLNEVLQREIALNKKEAEYKDKIKQEIVEGFLKGIKLG